MIDLERLERLIQEFKENSRILQGQVKAADEMASYYQSLLDVLIERNPPPFNIKLLRKIEEVEHFSTRIQKCLKNENIIYLGELVQKSEQEMLRTPNFGRTSLNELKLFLRGFGCEFGMPMRKWPDSSKKNYYETIAELRNKYEKELNE